MPGRILPSAFRPAWWLRSAHGQTVFPNIVRRVPPVPLIWESFSLSDGDFVELAWSGPEDGPLAMLIHGLGGSAESPYLQGLTRTLTGQGWRVCLFHFRGCGPRTNLRPTGYHSGMTSDPLEVLQALAQRHPDRPRLAVGFSMGGNVLLRLLGEEGQAAPVDAAVAVSVPLELRPCADRLNRGISRAYQRVLLQRVRRRVQEREELLREVIDLDAALQARNFWEFDAAFTAPLHAYDSALDYYERASSRPILGRIARPTLILHAADDPFMVPEILPEADELAEPVTLELSARGGHVGFVAGGPGGRPVYWLEERIPAWLHEQLPAAWRDRIATELAVR